MEDNVPRARRLEGLGPSSFGSRDKGKGSGFTAFLGHRLDNMKRRNSLFRFWGGRMPMLIVSCFMVLLALIASVVIMSEDLFQFLIKPKPNPNRVIIQKPKGVVWHLA